MAVMHYRELIAWQKAMDFVVSLYHATDEFPKEEVWGLRSQVRRAAVSIPSNIAEGQGRGATREFLRFLGIAQGSIQETETQLLLAGRLGFLSETVVQKLMQELDEIGRITRGLRKALEQRTEEH